MERRALAAVFFPVEALEEIGPFRHHAPHLRAKRAERVDPRTRGQRLVRDIKWHDRQFHAGFHYDISRFRIDVDVEFSRRGDVAHLEIGPAHQHDLGDSIDDIGRLPEGGADIRERSDGNERHASRRFVPQGLDDEIDAVALLQRHRRIGQLRAVQAGLSVHMFGGNQLADHRRITAGENGHVGFPGQFADDSGVLLGQRQRHVSGHRDDAQNIQFLG